FGWHAELRREALGCESLRRRKFAHVGIAACGATAAVAVTRSAAGKSGQRQATRQAIQAIRAEGVILLGTELHRASLAAAETFQEWTGCRSLLDAKPESGQPQNCNDKNLFHSVLFLH